MSNNIEYEKRVMIDEKQYSLIRNEYLNLDNSVHLQLVNYYFDDEFLSLKNNHMVLRIRTINNIQCELTLKVKLEHGDLEINEVLDIKDVDKYVNHFICTNKEILLYINNVKKGNIKYITKLATDRIEVHYVDHLLVIDKNHYSNITDYDIEIESSSRELAESIILKYCKKYSLEYKEKYLSKSRRAFKALN